jgi:hypothetical protein
MSVVESRVISFNPVLRVARLLVSPAREWDRIDAEPARVPELLGYVGVLAAIPPTAKVLGFQRFGHGMIPLVPTVAGAVVQYALSLIAVFVLALAIYALAPSFDGRRDRAQALKMAAYGGTGYWVFGVLCLFPLLGGVGGAVSAYLYHVGLPRLMKAPKEKALLYMLATAGCALALFVAVSMVANLVAGQVAASRQSIMKNPSVSAAVSAAAERELVAAIDKQVEAAIKAQADAEARAKTEAMNAPIPGLIALLPNEVASYDRFVGQSEGADTASDATSIVDYVWGSSRFTLAITDLGAMSVADNIAKAAQAPSLHKSATGYERIEKLGGRLVTERWDGVTKSGHYGMVVANRFVIEASGHDVGVDVLKQAVNAVDASRLEVLAREASRP